jgi:hypothetical protein
MNYIASHSQNPSQHRASWAIQQFTMGHITHPDLVSLPAQSLTAHHHFYPNLSTRPVHNQESWLPGEFRRWAFFRHGSCDFFWLLGREGKSASNVWELKWWQACLKPERDRAFSSPFFSGCGARKSRVGKMNQWSDRHSESWNRRLAFGKSFGRRINRDRSRQVAFSLIEIFRLTPSIWSYVLDNDTRWKNFWGGSRPLHSCLGFRSHGI